MTRLNHAVGSKDHATYIFVEAFPRKNVLTLGASGKRFE
jgi:hypothetical protein